MVSGRRRPCPARACGRQVVTEGTLSVGEESAAPGMEVSRFPLGSRGQPVGRQSQTASFFLRFEPLYKIRDEWVIGYALVRSSHDEALEVFRGRRPSSPQYMRSSLMSTLTPPVSMRVVRQSCSPFLGLRRHFSCSHSPVSLRGSRSSTNRRICIGTVDRSVIREVSQPKSAGSQRVPLS